MPSKLQLSKQTFSYQLSAQAEGATRSGCTQSLSSTLASKQQISVSAQETDRVEYRRETKLSL